MGREQKEERGCPSPLPLMFCHLCPRALARLPLAWKETEKTATQARSEKHLHTRKNGTSVNVQSWVSANRLPNNPARYLRLPDMYSWPVFELFKAICKTVYEVDLQVYMVDLAKNVLAVKFKVACFLRILLNSKPKTLWRSKGRVSDLRKTKNRWWKFNNT